MNKDPISEEAKSKLPFFSPSLWEFLGNRTIGKDVKISGDAFDAALWRIMLLGPAYLDRPASAFRHGKDQFQKISEYEIHKNHLNAKSKIRQLVIQDIQKRLELTAADCANLTKSALSALSLFYQMTYASCICRRWHGDNVKPQKMTDPVWSFFATYSSPADLDMTKIAAHFQKCMHYSSQKNEFSIKTDGQTFLKSFLTFTIASLQEDIVKDETVAYRHLENVSTTFRATWLNFFKKTARRELKLNSEVVDGLLMSMIRVYVLWNALFRALPELNSYSKFTKITAGNNFEPLDWVTETLELRLRRSGISRPKQLFTFFTKIESARAMRTTGIFKYFTFRFLETKNNFSLVAIRDKSRLPKGKYRFISSIKAENDLEHSEKYRITFTSALCNSKYRYIGKDSNP